MGNRTAAEDANGSQDWTHPRVKQGLLETPRKMMCRGASSSMKGPKDVVVGRLRPESFGSKSLQIGSHKTRPFNLTATPHFPASRGRVTALFTYMILPTPLPPQICDPGNGTGCVDSPLGRGWTLAYKHRKIPFC